MQLAAKQVSECVRAFPGLHVLACEHYGNAFCKNHIQKFIIPTIANIVNNSYITNCLHMISTNVRTSLCSSFH